MHYFYKIVLTDLFLELITCLNDFLDDGTVAVVLLIDNACLGGLPVSVKLLNDKGLNLVDFSVDGLLGRLQGLVQGIWVAHDLQNFIVEVVAFLTHIVLHVVQAVILLVGIDLEGNSKLFHFLVDFLNVGRSLVSHLFQHFLDSLSEVRGSHLKRLLKLQINLHEVTFKLVYLLVELLLEPIVVEVVGLFDALELAEFVLSIRCELVNQSNRLLLGLSLRVAQHFLTIQDGVCLFLVAKLHIVMELLSEFLDLDVVGLEHFVILGEMLQDPALSVLPHDTRDHTNGAIDLC